MDLIASFSSQKINTFHFFVIHGLMANKDLVFLFDTGASFPILGTNNFLEIKKQKMITYPCVCHHVSIENTIERDFYFNISFNDINIPLLGSSFIDDCAYHHAINGNLTITGIKPKAGASQYTERNVLNFDKVSKIFADRIHDDERSPYHEENQKI